MLVTYLNGDCIPCVVGKAANMGISDRFFKRHGRWKSENAKDRYIKDALENRLSVSRSLGL